MKRRNGVLGILLAIGLLLASQKGDESQTALAQTTIPSCPVGPTINLTSGTTVSGMTPLTLGLPTTTNTFVPYRVVFKLNDMPIGQARQSTTNNGFWSMMWATGLAPTGSQQLRAHIFYNQTAQCQTASMPINITRADNIEYTFDVTTIPPSWSSLTNTVLDIVAYPSTNAPLLTAELNQFVVYQWETNIGTLTPGTNGTSRYSSGASAGSGRVLVRAFYGGKMAVREIPISVVSQVMLPSITPSPTLSTTAPVATSGSTGPTSAPTNEQPATSSTASTTPLTAEQRVQLIAKQIESQPAILSCANQTLSAARIEELKASGRRLSAAEFSLMKGCFSQTSFVIPSSYVPTEPTAVKTDLPEATTARINNMKSQKTPASDGTEKSALRLEGQAAPNSDVLIYVFSEPLVLYTKADENGNWVYDLVDPMEPGEHEAYAVVEETDGTYKRSSAFSFLIETAQASSENPNGYSLSVQSVGTLSPPASKATISLYMIGSVAVVFAVLVVGGLIFTRTLKHIPDDDDGTKGHGYGN